MGRYLIYLYHRYLDFRLPELDAVLQILGIKDISTVYTKPHIKSNQDTPTPFLVVNLPNDSFAIEIASRCVLIRGIYNFLAQAPSYDALIDILVSNGPLHTEFKSWSFWVDCFGQKLSLQEQELRREKLTNRELFPGPVQLKNPDRKYWLFEEKGIDLHETQVKQLYFGYQVDGNVKTKSIRPIIDKHTLKKRKFIGSTTMDHELSLLMANLAMVKKNSLVCDPFVGTASVLVACGHFGAICLGGDIDSHALHGTITGLNISSNFNQYELQPPDLIRWDISRPNLRRNAAWFDAIICDPPYGLRESAQAPTNGKPNAIPPQTILLSLLNFGANHLILGGRLVYVMACQIRPLNDYADHIPTHGSFQLVHVCVQQMTRKWVRLFITMEKRYENEKLLAHGSKILEDIGR